jgi:predicted CopG family antitoxin
MSKGKYVNVVIDRNNYEDLKTLGEVPESFNDVISRLLNEKRSFIEAVRTAKAKQQ